MSKQVISTGSAANDGTGDTLRGASIKINSNFTELYDSAQSAFSKANSGYDLANSAYAYANSSAVLIAQELSSNVEFIAAINSSQNTTISSVTTLATAAFNKANTATEANAFLRANAAFDKANSSLDVVAFGRANSSFDKANIAYTVAGNALNVSTGGTVGGNINLDNNQIQFDTGSIYTFGDSLLVDVSLNKALTIKTAQVDGFAETTNYLSFAANGSLIFPDGTKQTTAYTNSVALYANGAFAQANTNATDISTLQNVNTTQNTIIGLVGDYANGAFTKANTLINKSGDYVNVVSTDAVQLQYDPSGLADFSVLANGSWLYINSGGLVWESNTTGTTYSTTFGNDGVITIPSSVHAYAYLQTAQNVPLNIQTSGDNITQVQLIPGTTKTDGVKIYTNGGTNGWSFGADGTTTIPALNNAPNTARGELGDKAGMFLFSGAYLFYCYADYTDGSVPIWQKVSMDNTDWN